MTPSLLTTDELASNKRLTFWRDVVCDTFVELECESPNADEFFGSIRNSSVADIQLSHVRSSAQRVERTRARISRSDRDFFLLSLQVQGQGVIAQDGRSALLNPGDFALYDTTRPYDLSFREAFGQLVIRLPRRVVLGRLADAESVTALRISGRRGAGRLASTFLRQLHACVDDIDPLSASRLEASAVDLLATALAEQTGISRTATSESQVLLRRRILAFIDHHLGNPDLSCEAIAAAHRISERYLRKLFEDSGGVSEWIWSRRLDQAKRDLADPLREHISVTAIGYDAGFKDAAHFSRAFKARFGETPKGWRLSERSARAATFRAAPKR